MNISVKMLDGECWWGSSTAAAEKNPIDKNSVYDYDMEKGSNQTMPLFISNKGRYIWCEKPMLVHIADGVINLSAEDEIILENAGENLREAYLSASKKHFPFSSKVPPLDFFTGAQYNTWMELDYNQTQESVLKYARAIRANGYEGGVIMIDEGWHCRYGEWEFDFAKFPDPKAMVDELHSLGFRVMLWVVPLVTADGLNYLLSTQRHLASFKGGSGDKNHFLRTDNGDVALVTWWNGTSAILNMCREDDREYLDKRLTHLMKTYGVDGFKFDGGNISMYNPARIVNGTQTKYSPDELNIAWNEFGARYEYHEYKDTFKGGGKSVIQRIRDRRHSWTEEGLNSLVPIALLQGLIGHPFICPDMIGGGSWTANYDPNFKCDEELFVRMAQCSALFPMMQFSWAPWRMLSEENAKLCLEASKIHTRFADYITSLVKEAAVTGEPIVRHLEYEYPHNGYEYIDDQFMLGKNILVAPVLKKGQTEREVVLPSGKWLYLGEKEYEGGKTVTVPSPLEVLPYFVKK